MKIHSESIFNLFRCLSYFTMLITFASTVSCLSVKPSEQSISSDEMKASQALMLWLESRVDLMVKNKANCEIMARELAKDQMAMQPQLAQWREAGIGTVLTRRAAAQPELERELTQLVLKGDLVHSHCAYQSNFRDQLKQLLGQP